MHVLEWILKNLRGFHESIQDSMGVFRVHGNSMGTGLQDVLNENNGESNGQDPEKTCGSWLSSGVDGVCSGECYLVTSKFGIQHLVLNCARLVTQKKPSCGTEPCINIITPP